nr:retrotransposable element Tf2 [Tanacetum cinerariifolium]
MEILPESTSNSSAVAGNPVKEVLLKLNLPGHRDFHICFVVYERQNNVGWYSSTYIRPTSYSSKAVYIRQHFAPTLNNECLVLRAKHVTSVAKDKEVLVVADNGRREGMENSSCVVIQDIYAHADNDLPRPYATGMKVYDPSGHEEHCVQDNCIFLSIIGVHITLCNQRVEYGSRSVRSFYERIKYYAQNPMASEAGQEEVYGVYELYNLASPRDEQEHAQLDMSSEHPKITSLLSRFASLFQEDNEIAAAFMALSRPLVGLVNELRQENETFLRQIHQKLERNEPLPTRYGVWEDVLIDFITGLLVYKGLLVLLVVVDHFTKYAHFGMLHYGFNVSKVAEVFMDMVVKLHWIPKPIVSDRDRIIVSKFWKQLFKAIGTKLNHSTAYHPQTDGQTKVVNRRLEQYLRPMVSDRPQH